MASLTRLQLAALSRNASVLLRHLTSHSTVVSLRSQLLLVMVVLGEAVSGQAAETARPFDPRKKLALAHILMVKTGAKASPDIRSGEGYFTP